MVWGILTREDDALRKQLETHLVNDLVGKGYHAVSSLDVYASKAYDRLTAEDIIAEFKSTGVDAVITLVLLSKENEKSYIPPAFSSNPVGSFDEVNKYYSSIFDKIYTPGYYMLTTNYFWECKLFEIGADKLIYAAQTGSFAPATTELLAHENGLLIMKDMIRKKIILNRMPSAF